MATIIAGHFALQTQAQQAVDELTHAGFPQAHICAFYLTPPERHYAHPADDRHKMPAGPQSDNPGLARGEAAGAATGAAVGAIASPLTGPVGPVVGALVGAHAGSLVGTLSRTAGTEAPVVRQSGMLVAVEVDDEADQARAIDTLRALGATDIERADGTIADGDWSDFDATSAPILVDNRPEHRP